MNIFTADLWVDFELFWPENILKYLMLVNPQIVYSKVYYLGLLCIHKSAQNCAQNVYKLCTNAHILRPPKGREYVLFVHFKAH